ncbi:integrase [Vibrio cholerae]|nr:integrase [Vibrio cholerae]
MNIRDRIEAIECSGQLKLATVLEFSQYNRSDSLGVKPPLY